MLLKVWANLDSKTTADSSIARTITTTREEIVVDTTTISAVTIVVEIEAATVVVKTKVIVEEIGTTIRVVIEDLKMVSLK